jgi:hypothetical protein
MILQSTVAVTDVTTILPPTPFRVPIPAPVPVTVRITVLVLVHIVSGVPGRGVAREAAEHATIGAAELQKRSPLVVDIHLPGFAHSAAYGQNFLQVQHTVSNAQAKQLWRH